MACNTRLIKSRKTGEQVESKTWKDIHELTKDEKEADRLYEQLLTPEFKNFFGDWVNNPETASKVVNEHGEPLLVYHGSGNKFESFNKGNGSLGEGIYFSTDKVETLKWAKQNAGYSRNSELKNLMDFKTWEEAGVYNMPVFLNVKNPEIFEESNRDRIAYTPENTNYDGVIADKGTEIKVHNSNQIKSVFNKGEFSKDSDNIYFQKQGIESSKASPKVLKLVNEFFDRVGYGVKEFSEITDSNGKKLDVNAFTDTFKQLVGVVKGQEPTALPEEAMHIAVKMIKNENPTLFKDMMNKVSSFKMFQGVFDAYKTIDKYQIDGKPNIEKIKEEAIGKILAEFIINKVDGTVDKPEMINKTLSWWEKIKETIKNLFVRTKLDPFETVSEDFINEKITGEVKDNDTLYQVTDKESEKSFNNIVNDKRFKKTTTGDASSYEVLVGDKFVKVAKRVTDIVKQRIYEPAFKNKELSQEDIDSFEIDKATGTKYHGFIDDILSRFIDKSTGRKRDLKSVVDKTLATPNEDHVYSKLENYVKSVMDRFPDETKFLFEQPIYKAGSKAGKDDLAGTIDFLAITPDNIGYLLDWKFMADKGREDVTRLTKKAHALQLGNYMTMLKDYGVRDFREAYTIPIKVDYQYVNKVKTPRNIDIGDINYSQITDKALLPVPARNLKIGLGKDISTDVEDKQMTAFIDSLYNIYDKLESFKTKGADWQVQEKKLNQVVNAIREIVVKRDIRGIINFAQQFINNKLASVDAIKELIKLGQKDSLSKEQISTLALDFLETDLLVDHFIGLNNTLQSYLKDLPLNDRVAANKVLSSISDRAAYIKNAIINPETKEGLVAEFGDILARKEGVYNILSEERVVKPLTKMFTTQATSTIKTMQTLAPMTAKVLGIANLKLTEERDKLRVHKEAAKAWMGGSFNKAGEERFNKLIFKHDEKGKWTPHLNSVVSREFYKELDRRVVGKTKDDIKWIKDNIDVEAYKKYYDKYYNDVFLKDLDKTQFDALDKAHDKELREKEIEKFKEALDIDKDTAFTKRNHWLSKFPKLEKHTSAAYRDLQKPENKPVLDYYNYLQEINRKAHNLGLIGSYFGTFSAQIRKGSVEALTHGLDAKSALSNKLSGLSAKEGDFDFKDKLNGEPTNRILAAYTYDLAEVIENEDGTTYRDYSKVSQKTFKATSLFLAEMYKYEALTSIEGNAKLLGVLEESKKSLVFSKNKPEKDESGNLVTSTNNTKNIEYFKNHMEFMFYGRKYAGEDIGFNNPFSKEEEYISVPRIIDMTSRFISLKALGLNPASALSNLFGGNSNTLIKAGKYYSKSDLGKGLTMLAQGKFNTPEGKKFIKLLDHFVPFTENLKVSLGKEMDTDNVAKWLSSDGLMYFLRSSENSVQAGISHAYFSNTMIKDGKLVNILEEARRIHNYDSIFKPGTTEATRKIVRKLIDKEIMELQKNNLYNDKNIKFTKNGVELGLIKNGERDFEEEVKLRQLIQQSVVDSLGARTPESISQINMTLFGGSLMMFKNWIPRLLEQRYGDFSYNSGSKTYEMGRMMMVGTALKGDLSTKVSGLKNLLLHSVGAGGTNALIEIARKDYNDKVKYQRDIEQVGEGKSMFEQTTSEAQFIDDYLRGVKVQFRELAATFGLLGIFLASLSAGDDDEDLDYQTKGLYKWGTRMADKFYNELGFFYSPNSFSSLMGRGGLPALSFLMDAENFLTKGMSEIWYNVSDNQEAMDDNNVMKYPLRNVPGLSQFAFYTSMFNEDFSKWSGMEPKSKIPVINSN